MIRSVVRSLSYLAEDVVSVAKWAVGELVSEVDYRLTPGHVRQGWAAELADIEAGIDCHEPNARYLQWGGPETWPHTYCNKCGAGYKGEHTCLRDQSSAVPPTAERPSEVSAAPPSQTPSEGHPLFTTSLLLEQGAVYAEVLAEMEKDEDTAEWHRIDAAAMRERAEAFKAVENTT